MSTPLRATQFYAGLVTSSTPAILYTVPAGHRIILKSILYSQQTLTAGNFVVTVDGVGWITDTAIAARGDPGSNGDQIMWAVYGPGQVIRAAVFGSTSVYLNLSGSLLYI